MIGYMYSLGFDTDINKKAKMIADGHEDLVLLRDKAMEDRQWSAWHFDIFWDGQHSRRYFSVRAWSNLHNISLVRSQASQLGKAATKEHKHQLITIVTVGGKDEGLPLVCMYYENILDFEASRLGILTTLR